MRDTGKSNIVRLMLALVAIVVLMTATTTAASAKQSQDDTADGGPCTLDQLEGGYEPSHDGETCVLTGWNWDFGGSCPRSTDASVGEWGSVNCGIGECIICSDGGNTGHDDADDEDDDMLRCMSADECFTDEEDGKFTVPSISRFVQACVRLGGEVSIGLDDGPDNRLVACIINNESYACAEFGGPIDCTHAYLPEHKPAPAGPQPQLGNADASGGSISEPSTPPAVLTQGALLAKGVMGN